MTNKRNGKNIGYIRVSSVDQNTVRQLQDVDIEREFVDTASAKDANRPQLKEALKYLREGDTLVVHSMDRLARNVDDLRKIVLGLRDRDVTVRFVKEGLTFPPCSETSDNPIQTANNEMMLTMLGAIYQFERALIKERQREGIAIAKGKGVYRGRKRALSAEKAAALRQRVKAGGTKSALAREFGISRETLYAYLRTEAATR
jgi:DNA invertase Pin-like site-specific DNA recombinase